VPGITFSTWIIRENSPLALSLLTLSRPEEAAMHTTTNSRKSNGPYSLLVDAVLKREELIRRGLVRFGFEDESAVDTDEILTDQVRDGRPEAGLFRG